MEATSHAQALLFEVLEKLHFVNDGLYSTTTHAGVTIRAWQAVDLDARGHLRHSVRLDVANTPDNIQVIVFVDMAWDAIKLEHAIRKGIAALIDKWVGCLRTRWVHPPATPHPDVSRTIRMKSPLTARFVQWTGSNVQAIHTFLVAMEPEANYEFNVKDTILTVRGSYDELLILTPGDYLCYNPHTPGSLPPLFVLPDTVALEEWEMERLLKNKS